MLATLNDVLIPAQKGHYAVGLFNTTDTDMIEAAIAAAEELRSPIIIGTAEILLPYGELSLLFPTMLEAAKRASVPVVLHYDHGLTFERCLEALHLGCSSLMFDGSAGDPDKNIENTREMVKICHTLGVTIEGEIGHVGQAATSDNAVSDRYTTPEEAISFVEKTGVDALAIAIGTAHGPYKTKPCLDINRLREIRKVVDTPLVLHGGSGLSDNDFRNTVREGIVKINIQTDMCIAGVKAMREAVDAGLSYLEIGRKRVEAVNEAVKTKLRLFGSVNKA